MHIIIIGCGKMGSRLAKDLAETSHDICVIDRNKGKTDKLGSGFNGTVLNGVEIDIDLLEEAGIKDADTLLAMTQNDNINIVACEIAQNIYKVPTVIGRVYDEDRSHIYDSLGIKTINPINLAIRDLKEDIKCEQL
ncbi:MAG: TrkA family potassium uptake protein [Clostridium sp.]|uniref:TrkA family potassium uptake protein n=1 Tax=Clostridium sp. TaxID=1506 RepID=UPI003072A99B